MLSVSYTASERLYHMLADAKVPEDAVIRLVLDGDGFNLPSHRHGPTWRYDIRSPGESHTCHRRAGLKIARRQKARC